MAISDLNLYTYDTKSGIVIPDTSTVKSAVEDTMRSIFGQTIDVTEETAMGRLIEAITVLIVSACGVTAQNANLLNPNSVGGYYLDAIGVLFRVVRLTGESDDSYRQRILNSASRGSGFEASIRNAISAVPNVEHVFVAENGHAYPAVKPADASGVALAPHSVLVSVLGGDDAAVAKAIYSTKSAGCGYTNDSEYGTVTTQVIEDTATGAQTSVQFYRPSYVSVETTVTVSGVAYTGTDIETDVKNAIYAYYLNNRMGSVITHEDIVVAVASLGSGIVVESTEFFVLQNGALIACEYLAIKPTQYISTSVGAITVRIY